MIYLMEDERINPGCRTSDAKSENREMDVRALFAREILTRVLSVVKLIERGGGQGRNRTADAGLFRAAYRIADVV